MFAQILKFKTKAFLVPKNIQTLHEASFEQNEHLHQLSQVQMPNKIRVINFGTNSNLNPA
jgi:hypothetical protein